MVVRGSFKAWANLGRPQSGRAPEFGYGPLGLRDSIHAAPTLVLKQGSGRRAQLTFVKFRSVQFQCLTTQALL